MHREIQNAEQKQRFTLALRDLLYTRCFARRLRDAKPTETLIPAGDFCRRLSAANHGRDAWLHGWRVREFRPGGVIVAGQGERLRFAKAGDYAMTLAEDVQPCVGSGVSLRLRKESLGVQDGTYCALGEESPSPDEESDVLRIYLNALEDAAVSLVEVVTKYFNEWCVPFTLKIMLRPEDRDRSDATVLYLPKRYYHRFVKLLSEFPVAFSRLRDGVPLFTKRLRRGVGLAESPAGAESFGLNRCRLLADGIVSAWLDRHQDLDAWIQATKESFAAEGYSLARPYLNPGSRDVYSTNLEDLEVSPDVRRVTREPIVLTIKNVLAFMRERGLCTGSNAQWQVSEHSGRNRNFSLVRSDNGHGFFVKHLRVEDPESFAMMQREAAIYRLARENPDFDALKQLTPRLVGFEASAKAIVLEFIETESLLKAQQRLKQFPVEFGRGLGVALATLHSHVGRETSAAPPREIFAMRPPHILDAHRNGPLMRWLGPGQRLLIGQVRERAEFAQSLDQLAATWHCETFIHGDIKFENCLARSPVILVDWELADFGEASWDIGSVLQAYLSMNLLTVPGLETLKAAVQTFWQSYCEESGLVHDSRSGVLERSLQCAAARMLQTALEVMQGQTRPTPASLTLFDASVELITRTRPTAQFLGLD